MLRLALPPLAVRALLSRALRALPPLARALLALAVLALAGAGCGSLPPVPDPPPAPPPSSSGCSPGYHQGPAGGCDRDESNFGGRPGYFGVQA